MKETKFKDLPIRVQERMLDCQVEQGKPRDSKVFEENISASLGEGGFSWEASIEGGSFWFNVLIEDRFNIFFRRYPEEKDLFVPYDTIEELDSLLGEIIVARTSAHPHLKTAISSVYVDKEIKELMTISFGPPRELQYLFDHFTFEDGRVIGRYNGR